MTQNTHSHHRHFVAAPLFALMVAFSVAQGMPTNEGTSALVGSVIETDEGNVMSAVDGVDALVYSGKGFDGNRLVSGSALVRVTGAATLLAGPHRITAISGLYHITYVSDELTLVTLNAPALLETGDESELLLAGVQKRDGKLEPIALRFHQRQLKNAQVFADVDFDNILPSIRSTQPLPEWMRLAQEEWQQEVFGTLRYAVAQGDVDAVEAILGNTSYQSVFESAEGMHILSLLLDSVSGNFAITTAILEKLVAVESLQLAYALHPHWRDYTWTLPLKSSKEVTAKRILLLPESDDAPKAVSSRTIPHWVNAVVEFSTTLSDPIAYIEDLVGDVSKLSKVALANGYPERALRWAKALHDVEENLSINLPEETVAKIAKLQEIGGVNTRADIVLPQPDPAPHLSSEALAKEETSQDLEVVEVKQEPEKKEPEEVYPPAVVEQRTLSMLENMGAVFTVETRVIPSDPNTADVRGVLFSVTEGDYIFDFQFNVLTGEISDIIRNGKTYKYALSVETFRNWIASQQ